MNFKSWTILVALLMAISPVLHADPEVIIDAKFDQADADGKLNASGTLGEAPLTSPTKINESSSDSSEPPTQLRVGKEVVGLLKPPYLWMQIGQDAGVPQAPAGGGVSWFLGKLGLPRDGVYEVSFDAGAKQTKKHGGLLQVALKVDDPSSLPNPLHPSLWPCQMWFGQDGRLWAGGNARLGPYEENRPQHFLVRMDFDRGVWSIKADDTMVLEETSFPEWLKSGASGNFSIDAMSFGSWGGSDAQPNATFFLGNVKMIHLPSSPTPTPKKP